MNDTNANAGVEKGIIYVMTTVVPGLIKIGKTGSDNYEQRMSNLERNGYRNITGLNRTFAIEVESYSEKETMLHRIFEKSRVEGTELFALDVNLAMELLSSFDGTVVYPTTESKQEIFTEASNTNAGKSIPDGEYHFKTRKKISDNGKTINATVVVKDGVWILKKDSILGIAEDKGVSTKAKITRASLQIDEHGKLLEDFNLGECSPSHAGTVVVNQPIDGWKNWKDSNGNEIEIYKKKNDGDDD